MASSHLVKNSAILLSVFTFGICLAAGGVVGQKERLIDVEIDDDMELGDGDYMSKRTGPKEGDSIVVGSFSHPHDPSADYKARYTMAAEPTYKCVKNLKGYDAHRSDFETQIRKRTGDGSTELANREALADVPVTDYFVYVTQEMWICQGNKESENPTFYRVRNELFSIKDIREVHYGLGVSVSVIKHHLTLGKRVKIEEIKYFGYYATTKQLIKTSKLLIKSYQIVEDNEVSIPNLSKTFELSKKKLNDEGMAEVVISPTGESLKIGSSWKKEYDYTQPSTTEIRCERIQYWNPASFRPEVFKIKNIPVEGTTDQYHKIIIKFSDEEFEKMFTIVERIIWKCEHYQKNTATLTDDPAVYLVSNEIIGKTPIKDVSLFSKDLKSIYAVKLTGDGETVRYTDMSFYYCHNWERVRKDFYQPYEIARSEFVQIEYQGEKAKEFTKELHYHLDSGNVFSTFINEVGYHLRVGTPADQTVVDQSSANCEKIRYDDMEDIFKTDVAILMNKNGLIHSQEAIAGDYWKEFFKYTVKEAFLCTSDTHRFYRVVNGLSFEKPISEIQTFDGVGISTKRMLEQKLTVEITEVKYIDPTTGRAVKYVGHLIFDKYFPLYDNSVITTKKRVLKTKDEIIRLIDVPKTLEKFRDGGTVSPVFIGGGPNTLQFTPNPNVGVGQGSVSTVLFCKLTDKPLPRKPLAMFSIYSPDPDESEIEEMVNEYDVGRNSKYFEGLETEVWICNLKQQLEEETKEEGKTEVGKGTGKQGGTGNGKGTGEGGKPAGILKNTRASTTPGQQQGILTAVFEGGFIRVVNKQKLKSPAPNNVGIISYQEMDKVWISAGNGADDVITNAQNVRYHKKTRTNELSHANFAGYRVLDRTPKDISKTWKSGTQDLTHYFDEPKVTKPIRIHKTLQPPVRMYKKIFNEAGILDLVIGSQWKKVFGKKEMTILCKRPTTEGIDEKYKPELKGNDVSANIASYFDLMSQEVRECKVEGDVSKTIRRVVNTLKMDYEKIGSSSVKNLYFYDGIAVSYGKYNPSNGKPETFILEIGEVKYLSSTDDTVLKYEGLTKLELPGQGYVSATHLPKNQLLSNREGRRDFVLHDVLGADEVFKTDIGSTGIIVEVGEKIPQDAELSLDNLVSCDKHTSSQGYNEALRLNKYYIPRIFYYVKDGNTNILRRTVVPIDLFGNWFDTSNGEQITHVCTGMNGDKYVRAMTRLVFLSSVHVAAIYHYDGVTVHTSNPDPRNPSITWVEITEVKFYKQNGDKMKLVKFDGFVSYKENNEPQLGDGSGHEIRYYLDTPILHFRDGLHVGSGIAIEVGSQPEETIVNHDREKVICVEVKDEQLEENHATKVFTNFPVDESRAPQPSQQRPSRRWRRGRSTSLPTPTPSTSTNKKHWAAISKEFYGHYHARSQRLWNCTKESKLLFHAVINVMVMSDALHVARAFLRDGVKMDIIKLPDDLEVIETTELKFFTVDGQSNIKIISYVGEIEFETTKHPILSKLFSGSFESKIHRVFSDNAIVEEGHSHIQLLAHHRIINGLNLKLSTRGNTASTIKYMEKGETKIEVLGSQFTVLHVYDDWQYEITSEERDTPECTNWRSGSPMYLPRIIEYVDDKQYEFDAFALHRTFHVKTYVRLCRSNKHEYVEVLQYLYVKQPLNAIIYSGSVTYEEHDNNGKPSKHLKVHAIIDMKTKQLVKFGGVAFRMHYPTQEELNSLPATTLNFGAKDQE